MKNAYVASFKNKRGKIALGLLMTVCLTLLLAGCQSASDETGQMNLKIAKQFGLAYAPLTIMESQDLLKKHAPDLTVEWVQLANTAAIREAILSDELDVGFMGIPPFLIGADNGMGWKIFTGLSRAPLGLMTSNPEVQSLSDISETDRIALPQPGSIQHILLSMAAKRELGSAVYFDNQLVSMKHPDGVQMLMSDSEITMHFTSPPYIFTEKEGGMHEVISGDEAFGSPFTFIVGAMRDGMESSPEVIEAVRLALSDAMAFIEEHPEETLDILSQQYGIEKEKLRSYIYVNDMVYTPEVEGLETFIDFMVDEAYLTEGIKELPVVYSK